jgi:transcriptional regulator with XRE-family HTH domain
VAEFSTKEVGARIREARGRCALQQKDLAARLGIAPQELNRYECGRGGLPRPTRLLAIARATGTTVEWLLTGKRGTTEEILALRKEISALKAQVRTGQWRPETSY